MNTINQKIDEIINAMFPVERVHLAIRYDDMADIVAFTEFNDALSFCDRFPHYLLQRATVYNDLEEAVKVQEERNEKVRNPFGVQE